MKFGFGSKSKSESSASQEAQGEGATAASDDGAAVDAPVGDAGRGSSTTPKKGRPTPSRREAERARGHHTGPVTAPTTRKEARERRKAEKNSMTREERKAARAHATSARNERRQAMLDGDDRFVLERDRGPVRRFARDWVDTHRRPSNFFMPVALVIIVFQFLPSSATMLSFFQSAFLAIILFVVLDCVLIGRTINRESRERFGDEAKTGLGLGFYASMRAMQPRTLRTPRPRVKPGDPIPGD